MDGAVLILHVVPGTPTLGLWCPKCLLPSGYEVGLYILCSDGPRRIGKVRECHDCAVPLPADQDVGE